MSVIKVLSERQLKLNIDVLPFKNISDLLIEYYGAGWSTVKLTSK